MMEYRTASRGMVESFEAGIDYLAKGRNKNSRPIENNTRVERRGDDIAIKLHATDVATIHPDNSITLNSGGWLTVTTKARMNSYLGTRARIASDRGVWFVFAYRDWSKRTRYFDGIRISSNGVVLNPMSVGQEERQAKAETAMAKRIRKYVDDYMKELDKGMPCPSSGDCWDCAFVTDDGKSMGDLKEDQVHGHLFSHITERYYVPTLIWNAMKDRGFGNVNIRMALALDVDTYNQGTMRVRREYQWLPDENRNVFTDKPDRHEMTGLRKSLTKYLTKRLIKSRAH